MKTIFNLNTKQNLNTPYNYAYPFCNQIYKQLAIQELKIGDNFTQIFKREVYPKDYYLLKPGQIANKFWIIEKGKAILFRNCNGNQVVSHFFMENDIMAMYPSYCLQIPTEYGICLDDRAVVYEAKWVDLQQLQTTNAALNDLERKLISLFLLAMMDHSHCLQTMKKNEHITYIHKHKPLLLTKFQTGQVKTYFGMGDKTVYRGRKKLQKQRT